MKGGGRGWGQNKSGRWGGGGKGLENVSNNKNPGGEDDYSLLQSRFNTNDKRHFLTYTLTRGSNFTTYDGTTINKEDRKEF